LLLSQIFEIQARQSIRSINAAESPDGCKLNSMGQRLQCLILFCYQCLQLYIMVYLNYAK